jgi:hypothetical protein
MEGRGGETEQANKQSDKKKFGQIKLKLINEQPLSQQLKAGKVFQVHGIAPLPI